MGCVCPVTNVAVKLPPRLMNNQNGTTPQYAGYACGELLAAVCDCPAAVPGPHGMMEFADMRTGDPWRNNQRNDTCFQ